MATVWINGVPRQVAVGTRLSAVLSHAPHPCGGKGVCGKCRVQATGALSPVSAAEERHLTAIELADDWRLSCCTLVQGDCRVTVATVEGMAVCVEGETSLSTAAPAFSAYGVAVDIGTTTLAARLYDAAGHLLAQVGGVNPQATFGADVLSRVQAAGEGQDLTTPLRGAVNALLGDVIRQAGVDTLAVDCAVITGNTAMLCFLVGVDTAALAHAPFNLPHAFDEERTAAQIGLTALETDTAVYLPPCASAFIGADAVCAALACGVGEDERTTLLADMGTNGEMLLGHGGTVYACSTAAGPAFEGVGISRGMPAVTGAVDAVSLVNGQPVMQVIGGGKPLGFCGSGLVDATACLLATEEMDRGGCLGADAVSLGADMALTQEDVRALQQAKGAVAAGLETLLQRASLTASAVEVLYTAGGFGSRMNGHNAAAIGLIPRVWASRIRPVGNAALDGASHLLLDAAARQRVRRLVRRIHVVELATDPYFAELFIKRMPF